MEVICHSGVLSRSPAPHRVGLGVIFLQPCGKVDEDTIFSHTSDKGSSLGRERHKKLKMPLLSGSLEFFTMVSKVGWLLKFMKPLKVYENFEKSNVYMVVRKEKSQNCNVCDSKKVENHSFYQHDHEEKIWSTGLWLYFLPTVKIFSEP